MQRLNIKENKSISAKKKKKKKPYTVLYTVYEKLRKKMIK